MPFVIFLSILVRLRKAFLIRHLKTNLSSHLEKRVPVVACYGILSASTCENCAHSREAHFCLIRLLLRTIRLLLACRAKHVHQFWSQLLNNSSAH